MRNDKPPGYRGFWYYMMEIIMWFTIVSWLYQWFLA